jgi:hypothetical protein
MEFLTPQSSFLIVQKKFLQNEKKRLLLLSADFILRAIQLASRLLCLTRVS